MHKRVNKDIIFLKHLVMNKITDVKKKHEIKFISKKVECSSFFENKKQIKYMIGAKLSSWLSYLPNHYHQSYIQD